MTGPDEEEDDGGTNIWRPEGGWHARPAGSSERSGDEPQSASARAYAEGWPAQPGWVPEGGLGTAWGAPADQQTPPPSGTAGAATPAYGQSSTYGQASTHAQTPAYGQTPPGAWSPTGQPTAQGPVPGGYPTPPPYPGPATQTPRSNTGVIVAAAVAVVLAIGAATGAVLYSQRDSSPPTTPVASAGTTSEPGTSSSRPSTRSSGGTTRSTPTPNSTEGRGDPLPDDPPVSTADLVTVQLPDSVADPDSLEISRTLDAYFTGINSGDYSSALAQLTPSLRAENPIDEFTEATSGTIDHDVTVNSAGIRDDGTARAAVTFRSTQPGDKGVNPGETCTNWSISYTLVQGSGAGGWLISRPSAQHSAC